MRKHLGIRFIRVCKKAGYDMQDIENTIYDKLDLLRVTFDSVKLINEYSVIVGDENPFGQMSIGKKSYLISTKHTNTFELNGVVSYKRYSGFSDNGKHRSDLILTDKDRSLAINEQTGEVEVDADSVLIQKAILDYYSLFVGHRNSDGLFDILLILKGTGRFQFISQVYSFWKINLNNKEYVCFNKGRSDSNAENRIIKRNGQIADYNSTCYEELKKIYNKDVWNLSDYVGYII